jgi:hypothetical protein
LADVGSDMLVAGGDDAAKTQRGNRENCWTNKRRAIWQTAPPATQTGFGGVAVQVYRCIRVLVSMHLFTRIYDVYLHSLTVSPQDLASNIYESTCALYTAMISAA